MSKHIGMTLRIGAAHDDLIVEAGGRTNVFDRAGMTGHQKKALLRDVQRTRHHNAAAAF